MNLLLLIFTSFIFSNNIADTIWVDNPKSIINWTGYKISGSHNGKIKIKNGYILKNKNLITGGEILVDMNSISVDDIDSPKWNQDLVDHLKSEDFFDVKKFPLSTLRILSSKESFLKDKLNTNIEMLAELTIKNITHRIPIYLYIDFDKNISTGELILDRTKWNIKYGSSSFFDDLGDKAIYNDFVLNFQLFQNKSCFLK